LEGASAAACALADCAENSAGWHFWQAAAPV
jgi:hypothetical protein